MPTGCVLAAPLVAPGRYESCGYPLPDLAPGRVLVKMEIKVVIELWA
jgi:hypothetical protein